MSLVKTSDRFKISHLPSQNQQDIFKNWAKKNIDDLEVLYTIYERFLPNTLSFNIFINYIYNSIHTYYI